MRSPGSTIADPRRILERQATLLAETGARLRLIATGGADLAIGEPPARATVRFASTAAIDALDRADHLALAEAYLAGEVDVEGDLLEVMRVTEHVPLDARPLERLRLAWQLLVRDRRAYDRESIRFHYDRPAEFFLPWLGRWRCYSHGLYAGLHDDLDAAMSRKMERAIAALGLEPGMQVFDMGGGWGCFVEYAGLRGIHVHAITISEAQHRFVEERIRAQSLPCSVELVHFRDYAPKRRFDGAVFMGTFEHNPEYPIAARWLARHLAPEARVWADFCAQRTDFTIGAFMKRHVWPGPIRYVDPMRLSRALLAEGFNVHELADDTLSYACTVRDWADRLDAHARELADRFGERDVRIFRLFLRGSQYFLFRNRTQAYHLVAGREPAPLVG